MNAHWDTEESSSQSSETYEASLQVVVTDGIGVIASISMALADMKVSINSINTQLTKYGDMIIHITVGCKNTSHFDSIVARLRSLPKVVKVDRAFGG